MNKILKNKLLILGLLILFYNTEVSAQTNALLKAKKFETAQQSDSALHYYLLASSETSHKNVEIDNSILLMAFSTERYKEGIPSAKRILMHKKNTQQEYNTDLYFLATLYFAADSFDHALIIYTELLKYGEKRKAQLKEDRMNAYLGLANCQFKKLNYTKAYSYFEKALVLAESNKNKIIIRQGKGICLLKLGIYNKAKKYLEQTVIESQSVFPNDFSMQLNGLSSLGIVHYNMLNYLEALEIFNKIIAKHQEKNIKHLSFPSAYHYKAKIKLRTNQLNEAIKNSTIAFNLNQSYHGVFHPECAASLLLLGQLFREVGEFDQALESAQMAKEIYKKHYGQLSSHYRDCLDEVSVCFIELKDFSSAKTFAKESLKLSEELKLNKASSLNNLGRIATEEKEFDDAINYFNQLIKYFKSRKLNSDPHISTILINKATAYYQKGDYKNCAQSFKESLGLKKKFIDKNLIYLNEKETIAYTKRLLSSFDALTSLAITSKDKNLVNISYLNSQILQQYALLKKKNIQELSHNDKQLKQAYQGYQIVKALYSNQNNSTNKDSLLKVVKVKETQLTSLFHKKYDATAIVKPKSHKDLEFGKMLMQIKKVHYYNNGWTQKYYYIAYLARKEWKEPKMLVLFEEKKLKKIITRSNNPSKLFALRGSTAKKVNKTLLPSEDLYKLIWEPLQTHLKDIKHIYFSTDGLLHKIPFAALPFNKDSTLTMKYNLEQISSTALLAKKRKKMDITNAVLVGGITYNFDSTGIRKVKSKNEFKGIGITMRDSRSSNSLWNYLSGTKLEVNSIAKLLKSDNIKYTILDKNIANEENIKELSGRSPSVLHIATHGFFYKSETTEKKENLSLLGQEQFTMNKNPLLRSGLILSGANYAWKNQNNPYRKEDGILTALEISNLDLSNTKLVVLSACETALGDIDGSEGVLGLQRAFKMAGVDKIIMSLWKVRDVPTAKFMKLLYSYWISGKDNTIHQAFRKTQLKMQKDKHPPVDWAGFVLVE